MKGFSLFILTLIGALLAIILAVGLLLSHNTTVAGACIVVAALFMLLAYLSHSKGGNNSA